MAQTMDFQMVFKNGEEPSVPVNELSISKILLRHRESFPDKEALVFVDPKAGELERLTYDELYGQVMALAHWLKNVQGLKAGEAVALNLENAPEILLTHLAAWLVGCTTVPLDVKRDDFDRKKYKVESTNCRLVITSEGEEVELGVPSVVLGKEMRTTLTERLPLHEIAENPENTSLILFTSGTTNLPKGVQLSLTNLLLNAQGIQEWLKIITDDRFHIVLPLHHINSTTMSLATLCSGGTIVLSTRYSKSGFWRVMAEHGCTLSSVVPTIAFDMLSEQEAFAKYKDQLQQVTRIQIGSAPVMPSDVLKFYDLYGIRLVQGYGSTETALRVTGQDVDGLNDEQYRELVAGNSIGNELTWNNVEVLGENGQPMLENEEGEICIRGPILTKGYLDNEKANREAFVDGWFHSGDVGYWKMQFGKKVFFISGRKKEIIIKGGVNISPLVIEQAILKNYPKISTCYAASVPDPRYGEEIGVVVAFDETVSEKDRQSAVAELKADAQKGAVKGVGAYESPRFVFEVSLTALPATSTGKVQRVNIKQYFDDMFLPIAETKTHSFHRLTPFDSKHIEALVKIHNTRWGKDLGIDVDTARQAVANGVVIGAIDKSTSKLVGSAFGIRVHSKDIENKAQWLSTYDSATANLTLKTNVADGDALMFVTISTDGKPFTPSIKPIDPKYKKLLAEAPKHIDDYLATKTDPVLNFHMAPKAGLPIGASVLYPTPNARPKDVEALGYCVMMKYPELPKTVVVQETSSLGTQILEAGFVWAEKHRIKNAYAYSRPSGFLKTLKQII